MKCPICDSDNWHSMEKINPERELLVCKKCGGVFYRVDEDDDKKLADYYRTQYRKCPDVSNLLTTKNKEGYIKLFLHDFLTKAQKESRRMVVGDVGAATGYLVAFFRAIGHRATGCELTTSFRRFSEHFYGVPLTEELEPKHKYDLITIYHVLEHMSKPDEKLKKYAGMLADGGRIMVACPEYFDVLEESSGSDCSDFCHLFHKDHINAFSARSIKNLFAKVGLVVEKEDHAQYGQTYLLRKATGAEITGKNAMEWEPWERQAQAILKTKAAIDLFKSRKFKEAIEVWPKFPEAWIRLAMEVHGKEPDEQARIFDEVKQIMPDNHRILRALAMWLYQQQRYDDAIMIIEQLLQIRPASDLHTWRGWCLEESGRIEDAMQSYHKSLEGDPRKWDEMMRRNCALACKLPAWDERAAEGFKQACLDKSGFKPNLKDPAMEQPVNA